MKLLFASLLLLISLIGRGQSTRTMARWPLSVVANQPLRVHFDQPYTSALVRITTEQPLTDTYLVAGTDTLLLRRDPHAEAGYVSALCVFREPVRAVTLLPGTWHGEAELISLYAPPLPTGYMTNHLRAARTGTSDCNKPAVIPASVWRKGLAPPKDPPTANKVQFIIIHHSAGSNAVSNYTEEVRNIYLLHTTVNGWNDVGYNFLLGRDGVIYEGRDGQGLMDGDNVLGAHFCSTNTGTMGICLMGNYNDVQPSDSALAAIDRLTGWKLRKEGLEPLGLAMHASSSKVLNRISGHRDGVCSTECPGDKLYAKLSAIRQEVDKLCSFTSVVGTLLATEPTEDWTLYPNPGSGPLTIRHPTATPDRVRFEWIDALGRITPARVSWLSAATWQLDVPAMPYSLLRCIDGESAVVRKVWQAGAD